MIDPGIPPRPMPPTYPSPPQRTPTVVPPTVAPPPAAVYTTVSVPPTLPAVLVERLLDQRVVLLGGELDGAAAHLAVGQLVVLAGEDGRRPITVHVACRGGDPAAALAVHDALRGTGVDVVTRAGAALDALGVLLVAAGSPGHRYAAPHALLGLPRARPERGADDRGPVDAARSVAELIVGYGRDLGPADTMDGRSLTAEQARDHGLVDHVDGAAATDGP